MEGRDRGEIVREKSDVDIIIEYVITCSFMACVEMPSYDVRYGYCGGTLL